MDERLQRDHSKSVAWGAFPIIIATGIGGGAGYLLTVFAGVRLGAELYGTFAVFWSGLYLVVSALGGVQQEVARAVSPVPHSVTAQSRPVVRNFGVAASMVMAVVVFVCFGLAAEVLFPVGGMAMIVPLAVGVAASVAVVVMSGVLYGLNLWRAIASMIIIEAVLRLILTGTLLFFTTDLTVLAWAVVAPFALTPLLMWLFVRGNVIGRFSTDVGMSGLTWNAARTVAGAAATGVLVSGFPFILGATSHGDQATGVAALMFSINLARAPIVIVVLSLQSYLVILFQGKPSARLVIRLLGLLAGATVLASALAWVLGPGLLETFFGSDFVVSGPVLAAIVGSGGAVGSLCVTGPAVLARSNHAGYSAGWLFAAAATLALLLLPIPLELRVSLSLWAGPLCGLAVHFWVLLHGKSGTSAGQSI